MQKAETAGVPPARLETPGSALSWIRPETVVLTDFSSGIDLGLGLRLLDSPEGLFGFPKGMFSAGLQLTANHVAAGIGIDIGGLIGRPELSLIQATVGGGWAHRWRSNDNGPDMYVSVSKLF